MRTLELLTPEEDKEHRIAAIRHGDDAVYIEAPKFGARAATGNFFPDIEDLLQYAYLYHTLEFNCNE